MGGVSKMGVDRETRVVHVLTDSFFCVFGLMCLFGALFISSFAFSVVGLVCVFSGYVSRHY